jgi:hypothetical protein
VKIADLVECPEGMEMFLYLADRTALLFPEESVESPSSRPPHGRPETNHLIRHAVSRAVGETGTTKLQS